ncbi:MAG TPA: peptidase C45, partial [bacterium]|nr:peptidase C45 [bacterium]
MSFKRFFIFSALFVPVALILTFTFLSHPSIPQNVSSVEIPEEVPENIEGTLFKIGESSFRRSSSGLYELYVEGDPVKIGIYQGRLTQDLIKKQETIFVDMLNRFVPGKYSRFMIKKFIYMFNKQMQEHVPQEYLKEIYALSRVMEDDFGGMGDNYFRVLNYHAAHDIGHMVTNLNLVGCTAFSVKGTKSENSDLITGRNFDFFIGDRFAKDKIVSFVKPDNGFPFVTVS